MGIKDFVDVCPPTRVVGFKDIADKRIAVDTYVEIFRTSGIQYISGLTNPQGEPTQHIKSILSNLVKMESLGIKSVWCIDSREAPIEKKTTVEERQKQRDATLAEVKTLDAEIDKLVAMSRNLSVEDLKMVDPDFEKTLADKKAKLAKLDCRVHKKGQFNKFVEDVLFILTKLGVRYCVAPPQVESEHLAAYLCQLGVTDGVMTTDTDAMAFGAPWMIKKIPKKTGKYEMIERKECLKDLDETQFLQVCVALGCDYAEKAPGVGPKTVVKKVKSGGIAWSDKQKKAIEIFQRKLTFAPQIVNTERTRTSIEELKKWLVEVQGFGKAKLDEQLDPLIPVEAPK